MNLCALFQSVQADSCNIHAAGRMLWTLVLLTLVICSKAEEEGINWEEEISLAKQRYVKDASSGAYGDVLLDTQAPNFTEISPWYINEGDSKAFVKEHKLFSVLGHTESGEHHIVATCGNIAVTWQRRLRRTGNDSGINGTGFTVFEYTGGKAQVQFYQMTI